MNLIFYNDGLKIYGIHYKPFMNTLLRTFVLVSILPQLFFAQEKKTYKVHTVAFYNLENLFDYQDDPFTYDNDRTPEGKDRWTQAKYQAKLANMATVLSQIGKELSASSPALIGLCEIENRRVLEDLLNQPALKDHTYGIVHYDSPDRRGIDVALLYKKNIFIPTHHSKHPLLLYDLADGERRIYTRDQLLVKGYLDGDMVYLMVNHWPSRSGGEEKSRYKRIRAAQLSKHLIDSIFSTDPYAKIISMGDLNDDPTSASVKKVLKPKASRSQTSLKGLYNPMEQLFRDGHGTLAWRDRWNLFDQMLVSKELIVPDYKSYRLYKAGIFNKRYLTHTSGRYKGYPLRSLSNGKFTGGYSDHFPVYLYLIKEVNTGPN